MTDEASSEKPSVTLPATVEKIIKPLRPQEPEKVQIAIEGADDLYREIRIENALTNQDGQEVRMKEGTPVEVKVEVDPKDVAPPNAKAEHQKR